MNPLRAWITLTWFSFRRQLRSRLLLWIAAGLFLLGAVSVLIVGQTTGWNLLDRKPHPRQPTYAQWLLILETMDGIRGEPTASAHAAIIGSMKAALDQSGYAVFARGVVNTVFIGFLLPLWCLSFAVNSFGAEREGRSLVWLTTRPIPRSAQYLAKLLGTLPWVLAFNLVGFWLICMAAGGPGPKAFADFWPSILGASLAFTTLFHLIGAVFPWPAVVSLVYAFVIEFLASDFLPGTLKRVSISYYARCLVYHDALEQGWELENAATLQPLSPTTCWTVLMSLSVAFTVLGMIWYARTEYRDEA